MSKKRFNRLGFNTNPSAIITKAVQYAILTGRNTSKRFNRARFNRPITAITNSITKLLEYVILVVQVQTIIQYAIRSTGVIIKDLQYSIHHDATQKVLSYAIRAIPDAIVLPVVYYVYPASQLTVRTVAYKIKHTASGSVSLRYRLKRVATPIVQACRYYVRISSAPIVKSTGYTIRVAQSVSKSSLYIVRASKLVVQNLTYEIQSGTSLAKGVMYYIRTGPAAIQMVVQYYIGRPPIEIPLQYFITRSISTVGTTSRFNRRRFNRAFEQATTLSKNVTYNILQHIDPIVLASQYAILISTPIVQSIQYVIRATKATSLDLDYYILWEPSIIQKDLEYQILVGSTKTVSVEYAIRSSTDILKSLTYIVQASVGSLIKVLEYRIATTILVHEPALWKQTILVGSPGGAGYPCEVVVPWDPKMATNFSDIRFGDDYTGQMYAATRVSYTPSTTATFRCTIPSAGQTSFTMFYGNTTLAVQADVISGVGAVAGIPAGSEVVNETFLYRYTTGAIT